MRIRSEAEEFEADSVAAKFTVAVQTSDKPANIL